MPTQLHAHLMFQDDDAGDALALYETVFNGFRIDEVDRYGPDDAGTEGSIRLARFTVAGTQLTCIDSPIPHDFDFTPSTSLWVDCETDDELEATFAGLSDGGEVLMALDDYGFSTRYGWVNDPLGVSWQLDLP